MVYNIPVDSVVSIFDNRNRNRILMSEKRDGVIVGYDLEKQRVCGRVETSKE